MSVRLPNFVTLGISTRRALAVSAAPCDNVAALRFANTTITSVQIVAAGGFTLPADSPTRDPSFFTAFGTLRACCRVQGVIQPSSDSHIEFKVCLPASGWNRKYMAAGPTLAHSDFLNSRNSSFHSTNCSLSLPEVVKLRA